MATLLNKDGDYSSNNDNSNGGYCITTKMARVLSLCPSMTSAMGTNYVTYTERQQEVHRDFIEALKEVGDGLK